MTVRLALYWLLVGVPLAWGVFKTLQNAVLLFGYRLPITTPDRPAASQSPTRPARPGSPAPHP